MAQAPRRDVEILLTQNRVKGRVQPSANWLEFMNDSRQDRLIVTDARIYANDVSDQRSVETATLSLAKSKIMTITLLDPEDRKSVQIPEWTRNAVLHMEDFICNGGVHLGPCDPSTMLDDASGDFIAMTSAYFASRRPLSEPLPAAEILLVNRKQVQLYYWNTGRKSGFR